MAIIDQIGGKEVPGPGGAGTILYTSASTSVTLTASQILLFVYYRQASSATPTLQINGSSPTVHTSLGSNFSNSLDSIYAALYDPGPGTHTVNVLNGGGSSVNHSTVWIAAVLNRIDKSSPIHTAFNSQNSAAADPHTLLNFAVGSGEGWVCEFFGCRRENITPAFSGTGWTQEFSYGTEDTQVSHQGSSIVLADRLTSGSETVAAASVDIDTATGGQGKYARFALKLLPEFDRKSSFMPFFDQEGLI